MVNKIFQYVELKSLEFVDVRLWNSLKQLIADSESW